MKNYIAYICIGMASLLMACDPITDRMELGGIVAEEDLKVDVYSTTEGGNQVVMVNETPQVGSYWNYIINVSVRQRDTVLLPFLGEQTITFTGLCNGGTVTTTRKVNIEKIDHALAPEWAYLAGTGKEGKTWVWNLDEKGLLWGNGGYLNDIAPAWWGLTSADIERDFPDELGQSMTFDLNGGANFVRKAANESTIEKGSFILDPDKKKANVSNTGNWSLGYLQINDATVMHGISPNEKNAPVHNFDILLLNEDYMILAYPEAKVGAYGTCWYWKFKAKK